MCVEEAARTIPGSVFLAWIDTHGVSKGQSWREHTIRPALSSCCLTNKPWDLKAVTVKERLGLWLHLDGRAYAKKLKINSRTGGSDGTKAELGVFVYTGSFLSESSQGYKPWSAPGP